jgi:hypothetical protein
MKVLSILLLLIASVPVRAQTAPEKPKAFEEQVYYNQSWEQGEIKSCLTYSNQPFLVICDEQGFIESRAKHIVNDGMSKEDATKLVLDEDRSQAKSFVVQFIGKYPWKKCQTMPPKPGEVCIPPGTPNVVWIWPRCSKDKISVCKM